MPPKSVAIIFIFSLCIAQIALALDCSVPLEEINLDLWSTKSLPSPDRRWKFVSVGPKSSEKKAVLYIQNKDGAQRWKIGSLERDGTVFWSEDSKRLFLRDEYAADDTKIRVFDLTAQVPKEIDGLDRSIRKLIFTHISEKETTLWLTYPHVCFVSGDSSTIFLVADAPRVQITEISKGKKLSLQLSINVVTLQTHELSIIKE